MTNNRREIKFRAWLKLAKEMVEVRDLSFYTHQRFISYKVCKDETVHSCYKVEKASNFILMQYVGLKDINNKEIYEGDIINYYNKLYVVDYMFTGFYLHDLKGGFIELAECDECCEVVGNIYENPEMIQIDCEEENL